MTVVREAMLHDPRALDASASAQDAAELLVRPEVRAVLVVDGDRLVGLVTPAALVERVVAAGRDPRFVTLGEIAEDAVLTVGPETPVEEAYRLMEQEDVERLPVTEEGRLVGVLSRSALQRRLAEDEPPPDDADLLEA
jgi:signal-transduction protein with cAMP-binding, CBS, and nucleotidyltransferase domain